MGFENGSSYIPREEISNINLFFGEKIKKKLEELERQISDVDNLINQNFKQDESFTQLKSICEDLLNFCNKYKGIKRMSHEFVIGFYPCIIKITDTVNKCMEYTNKHKTDFDLIENINAVINLLISFYNAIFDSVNEANGEIMRKMFSKGIEDRDLLRNIKKDTYINDIKYCDKILYVSIIKILISVLDQYTKDFFDGKKSVSLCGYEIKTYNDLVIIKNKFSSLMENMPKKEEELNENNIQVIEQIKNAINSEDYYNLTNLLETLLYSGEKNTIKLAFDILKKMGTQKIYIDLNQVKFQKLEIKKSEILGGRIIGRLKRILNIV